MGWWRGWLLPGWMCMHLPVSQVPRPADAPPLACVLTLAPPFPSSPPLQRFVEDCGNAGIDVAIEQPPMMQGRQMNMVLGLKKEVLQ